MDLREIVVLFDGSAAAEARLRLAIGLVRCGASDPPMSGMPRLLGIGCVAPHPSEEADAVERRFATLADGLPREWRVIGHGGVAELLAYARVADLTIMGRGGAAPGAPGAPGAIDIAPEQVVSASGTPILVMPAGCVLEAVGRSVVVAWDGSREAARALHDAMPLLRGAETIGVIDVGYTEDSPRPGSPSPEAVCGYLARHDIDADVVTSYAGEHPPSELLLAAARERGADLLVSGAYHHSRARETVLGGVTQDLLDHAPLPLLVSH